MDQNLPTSQSERLTAALLATDTRFARQLGRFLTDFCGIDVVESAQSTEALIRLAKWASPAFILFDISPDGLEGLRTVARLHSEIPGANLIVISSLDPEYRLPVVQYGADACLEKARIFEKLPGVLARTALGERGQARVQPAPEE